MERVFGREVANLQEHPHARHPLRNRPHARSVTNPQEDQKANQARNPLHNNPTPAVKPLRQTTDPQPQDSLALALTDYFDEAMGFMLSQESGQPPCQPRCCEVSDCMRTILLDWIVDVHLKFKMFPQTLFLVAGILDKFLATRAVRKEDLQLVGAAALFVAAKYEETYQVPEIAELVSLSAKVFSKNDLLRMEAEILRALDFNLVFNTAYHFLEPFCKLLAYEPKRHSLAQYILELALLDGRFGHYKASLVAASTIFLINKIKRAETAWPDVIMAASGYE